MKTQLQRPVSGESRYTAAPARPHAEYRRGAPGRGAELAGTAGLGRVAA